MRGESGSRAVRGSSSDAPRLGAVVTKGFEGKDECCSNFGPPGFQLYQWMSCLNMDLFLHLE